MTMATSKTNALGKGVSTFVLHVKTGYEDRAEHIERMMREKGISYEYILDGDMSDLDDAIINRYFRDNMACCKPETSCAMKHLIACREIIDRGLAGALVLEDDILLFGNFAEVFRKSLAELEGNEQWRERPVIINYEDTRLRFVPRSKRVKGRVLYEGDRDRMTGAIYVNARAAKLIYGYAQQTRVELPIDLLHCKMLREGQLTYLWCQPAIATQGSHTGAFKSGINLSKSSAR